VRIEGYLLRNLALEGEEARVDDHTVHLGPPIPHPQDVAPWEVQSPGTLSCPVSIRSISAQRRQRPGSVPSTVFAAVLTCQNSSNAAS